MVSPAPHEDQEHCCKNQKQPAGCLKKQPAGCLKAVQSLHVHGTEEGHHSSERSHGKPSTKTRGLAASSSGICAVRAPAGRVRERFSPTSSLSTLSSQMPPTTCFLTRASLDSRMLDFVVCRACSPDIQCLYKNTPCGLSDARVCLSPSPNSLPCSI